MKVHNIDDALGGSIVWVVRGVGKLRAGKTEKGGTDRYIPSYREGIANVGALFDHAGLSGLFTTLIEGYAYRSGKRQVLHGTVWGPGIPSIQQIVGRMVSCVATGDE